MKIRVTTKDGEHLEVETKLLKIEGDFVMAADADGKMVTLFHKPAKVLVV